MEKKEYMKELLFPTYLSNSLKILELDEYDYDKLRSDARLDLMTYIIHLENEGLSTEEVISKVISYNKCMSLNKLDRITRKNIVKDAIKTLKK